MQRCILSVQRRVDSLMAVPIEELATIALRGVPGAQLIKVARQTLTEAEVSFVMISNRAALVTEVKDRLSPVWIELGKPDYG